MTRVLVVAKRPPTRGLVGGDGDANIVCAALDEMIRRGHRVTVLSFEDELSGRPEHDHPSIDHVILPARPHKQAYARYPAHRTAVSAWQRSTPAARRAVADISRTCDVAYFHGISTFDLVDDAECPVVAHEIDPMSMSLREETELPGAGRLGVLLKRRAAADYERLERAMSDRASRYLVVTRNDADDLQNLLQRPVDSVPLGYRASDVATVIPFDRRSYDVAFVGALNFTPNRIALERYLDDVVEPLSRRHAGLRAIVAGRRSDSTIEAMCAGRAELVSDPESLQDIMATTRVCVFTNTFGRGERTTVREALSVGTPVAGFAWALRNLRSGPHAVIGDGSELIESVSVLLSDQAQWQQAADAALLTAREMPGWDHVSACLIDHLEAAIRPPATAR